METQAISKLALHQNSEPYNYCYDDRHQPVNNSTKHIRIVLSKMARAALLFLLLYGGAVVDRKIVSEYVRVAVDDVPEKIGNSTCAVRGIEVGQSTNPNLCISMIHSPHLRPSSWPRTTATTREERTAAENIFNHIGRAISDRQLL